MVLYKRGQQLQLAKRPRGEGEYVRGAPKWAGKKMGGGNLSDKQVATNERFKDAANECQKAMVGLEGNAKVEAFNSCIAEKMK